MLFTTIAVVFAAILFSSCSTQRADWALRHAEIQAHPPLPAEDLAAIFRITSRATAQQIVWLHRVEHPEHGRDQVLVMATSTNASPTTFVVEKFPAGWRITSQAEAVEE